YTAGDLEILEDSGLVKDWNRVVLNLKYIRVNLMVKVSPEEKMAKTSKQKKRSNGSNKYLKPGALAQLRNSKASGSHKLFTKKKADVMEAENGSGGSMLQNKCGNDIEIILSPEKVRINNKLQRTPKTPRPEGDGLDYESRLEGLPM
nr:hypothetical protein [Tanacetum cinerariifolium]